MAKSLFRLPKGNLAAEPTLSTTIKIPNFSPDLLAYKDGIENYLNGDFDTASISFKKALEINPDLIEAKRGLERLDYLRKNKSGKTERHAE